MFNSIDIDERIRTIIRKAKYIIPIIIVIIVLSIILFSPHPKTINFTDLEEKIITATEKYYNSAVYQEEEFISLHMLEDQQFLNLSDYDQANCNGSSGVLIRNGEFIPYLICPAYKSFNISQIVNETNVKLKLKGNNPLIINIDRDYEEPGYETSERVTVTGKVNNKLGLYNLNYRLADGTSLNRIVIVTDSDEDENINTKISNGLELSLKGVGYQSIFKDNAYEELGVVAYDSVDGDLSNKVEILGSVNTNVIGKYTLTYMVRNSRGYQLSTIREIEVEPPLSTPINIITNSIPTTLTNGKVTINLKLTGENYQYTLLPNNTKTYTTNINYDVNSNGTYKFKVYNKFGEAYEQKVVVSNIDKTLPAGNCYATSNLEATVINVISTTNKNQSYSYTIDGNYTSFTTASSYTFNKKATYAMVRIKDDVGNIKSVTCKLDRPTASMDQPLVYIYNSHQNESYSDVPSGQKSGVLQLALYMRDLLKKEGVPALVEEGDIYSEIKRTAAARKAIGASRYDVSKKFIEAAQKKNPSLVFFLDIHRNSSSPMTVIDGKEYAVFFFLIGASQKDYEKNLAVATAIDTPIRAKYPTLARKIYVRGLHNEGIFWYNQFMGQYFQLIEVGGDRSTLQQAKNTVDLITPYFAEYIKKTFMK